VEAEADAEGAEVFERRLSPVLDGELVVIGQPTDCVL
jgi:hypothetical protein